MTMSRMLVIGYGNRDRGDDGVAFHVINALRRELGQEPLGEEETGLCQLGCQIDSAFVLQLAPEWAEVAADYERLVFVDAHVHPDADSLCCAPVQPECTTAAFTHHMTPAMFLSVLQALYHRQPAGWMVSIRGHRFDFERELSDAAAAQVTMAVEQILRLKREPAETGSEAGLFAQDCALEYNATENQRREIASMEQNTEAILREAIQGEIESNRLYTDAVGLVRAEHVKEALRQLAMEELGHKTSLELMLANPGQMRWQVRKLQEAKIQDMGIGDHLVVKPLGPDSTFQDVCIFASKKERASHELYRNLAQQSEGSVRELLEAMSADELRHKNLVEGWYEEVVYQDF